MNGLNAYPRSTPRFQSGGSTGFSMGTAPDTSGVLDTVFSPITGTPVANTPFGTFGVSPATIAGLVAPAVAGPLGLMGLGLSAYNSFTGRQDPAPITDATVDAYSPPTPGIAIGPPASVSVQGISPGTTAPGPAQDVLDAMIANFAEEQAQQQTEAQQAQVAATVAATADAVDADAGATSAANAASAPASAPAPDNAPATDNSSSGVDSGPNNPFAQFAGQENHGTTPSDSGFTTTSQFHDNMMSADDGAENSGVYYKGGQVMNYEQGGQIMNYAQGGEAYGRGGDSMLVHMNPREVAGLQALARSNGTSMTINPNTGYPEAFNLKALLPALVGLGLNAFAPGVGSAIGSALGTSGAVGTGVAVGGATAAATGSLKKGIMAGLGAYGGAGLGEGLAGSGLAGTTPPAPGMEGVAGSGASVTPTPTAPSMSEPGLLGNTPAGGTGLVPKSTLPSIPEPSLVSQTAPPNFFPTETTSVFPPQPEIYEMGVSPGGSGATVSPNTPMASVTKPGLTAGQAFKYGSAALTPAMQPEPFEPPKSTDMIRPYDFEYNPQTGAYDRPAGDTSEAAYFSPTFTARDPYLAAAGGGLMDSMRSVDFDKEDNYYASGGLTAFKQGGRPKSRPLVGEDYYRFMGRDDTMLGTAEKNFAGGGTPRFLSGGGDGMSDDIPAVIGDKQPARLADGEFVIPADVVSHLGNGSSKAGAKRLYEMMADIRKERTGTKKQAPAIKPSKFMPA
jgi:hypothetical protein